MRNLIAAFIKYPFYANLTIAIILIAGGLSMMNMRKAFFPERKSNIITVSIAFPGASPKEMEEGLTVRIEEAIRGIVGIKEINSSSAENFATVTIETTGKYNIDETLAEVKNAVDGISSFPSLAEKPVVAKRRSTTWAMKLAVMGEVDLATLKKFAYGVEEDFLKSGIMSQIQLSGYPLTEISVEVKEENLLRYNSTFSQIAEAIAQNNLDISAGMIRSDEEEIIIRSRYRSVDPDKIGDIVLSGTEDGKAILIRDVATVKMQFSEVTNATFVNGKRAIPITINKLAEEDLQEISDFVHAYVKDFNKKNNAVKLEVTFDYLTRLESRLDLLLSNGVFGLVLVIISLAIFLNFRLSIWVAWGIPSAFLAMFIFANLYGITINMISLFGMILVVGILVDDGIVIGENIYSHFEQGKSPRKAALDGTLEVMPAVITSVLTTIVAFIPLMLLQGRMEMLFEMAFVVIFSLGFSLLEAFFVLPAHLGTSHVLKVKNSEKRNRSRGALDRVIDFMRLKIYGRLLKVIIKWKYVWLFLPVSFILITIGLFQGGILNGTFFPAIAFDTFDVNVAFTPGAGEKNTFKALIKFDKAVWEVNDSLMKVYKDTNSYVTFTFISMGSAFQGQENGAHAGNISVTLRDMEGAPVGSFEIAALVRKRIGLVPEAEKFTVGGMNRWGSPVSISLLGKNLEELMLAKQYLYDALLKMPQLKNITDNNATGKQEARLKLKPRAYFLGLDQSSITNQVRQGFYGGQAQRLQLGKDEVRVWVRYPSQDRMSIGQMETMKIKTPMGDYPLSELVEYTMERGPENIKRYNGNKDVRIDADLVKPYDPVPPILAEIQEKILSGVLTRFPGVRVEFQGQQKDSDQAMGEMKIYFGVAFVFIALILMIHFKSFSQAIIILAMIPLGLLGAFWGHALHGHPISILSAWGMIALTGVIINDAVVFMAKYNSLLLAGYKVEDAVIEAGVSRFRPIMLTTITTVAGLYPLILEKSSQAQFLVPMAIALAYGVLIGTAFILILFPALILVLNDLKRGLKWLWTGQHHTMEEVEKAIVHSKRQIEE